MSSYSEKLRDPRWQRRRLEIMQIAGFVCERCGSDSTTLAIHHLVYRVGSQPWCYPDHELVCLCEECHGSDHDLSDEDRFGMDEEARADGFLDLADLRLDQTKHDREAQRLGFKNDDERRYHEWRADEKDAV